MEIVANACKHGISEHEQITCVFGSKNGIISKWIPKSGWNASFFAKDKIVCASYYHYFRGKHMTDAAAETAALKKVFELKYGVLF